MNGKFKVRFYSDDSEHSKKVEKLLDTCRVPYVKITAPSEEISTPAVQYRGYLFEGYAEIATSLFCRPQ